MSHKHNLLPLIFSVLPMTGYGLGSANALFFDPFASVEETFFQNIDKTAYQLLEEMNQACELSGTPDLSSELENTITERWWDIFNYLPEEERRRLIKLLTALELPHDYFSSVSTEEDIFGEPEHMPDQLVPQPEINTNKSLSTPQRAGDTPESNLHENCPGMLVYSDTTSSKSPPETKDDDDEGKEELQTEDQSAGTTDGAENLVIVDLNQISLSGSQLRLTPAGPKFLPAKCFRKRISANYFLSHHG